jgi:hypothetical protein
MPAFSNHDQVCSLAIGRPLEHRTEPKERFGIDSEVERRQVNVAVLKSSAHHVERRIEVVDFRCSLDRPGERNVPHAMMAEKEAVIQHDINGSPQ